MTGMWEAWIGRSERRAERADSSLAMRWRATLDRQAPVGNTMPQGFHWCLCTPDAPTSRLGPDGHPRRDNSPDSFLPPVPLPRRMWASSKVAFLEPLQLSVPVERLSTITEIREKNGASGTLVFVDIAHETRCEGELAVHEVQTVVYRDDAPAGSAPVPPVPGDAAFDPSPWQAHRMIVPDERLLFRYSALTFNSHRIHYDLAYATQEEGYRGLVVHGPLTATLLLDLAQAELGDNALKSFAFRGLSPAICGEALHLVMRGEGDAMDLAAFASDGRQVMAASATG